MAWLYSLWLVAVAWRTSADTNIHGEVHQVPNIIAPQGRHQHPTATLPPSLKYLSLLLASSPQQFLISCFHILH